MKSIREDSGVLEPKNGYFGEQVDEEGLPNLLRAVLYEILLPKPYDSRYSLS